MRTLAILVGIVLLTPPVVGGLALAEERATDGDPVELFTGLNTREHDDVVIGGNPPIRLTRSYRNRDPVSRAFGIGTNHSYGIVLFSDSSDWAYVDLVMKDGGRIHYVRTTPGTSHEGAEFVHTATPTEFLLSRLRWTGQTWDIELRNGSRYRFGSRGHVIEIRDGDGHRLELERDNVGNLTRITGGWFRTVYLTYDAANRIVQARTGLRLAMTSVAYEYDGPGRLVKVQRRHLNALTVVAELLSSYHILRLPSLERMWWEQVMEYTYDDRHNMRIVKEPGLKLDHEYDETERVIRQKVTGWGVWEFKYTERQGRVVQTDVIDPDGRHRRVGFSAEGYTLFDTTAFGQPNEETTTYERTTGNVITRLTVTCRAASGVPVSVSAPVPSGTPHDVVRSRLRSQCGRYPRPNGRETALRLLR